MCVYMCACVCAITAKPGGEGSNCEREPLWFQRGVQHDSSRAGRPLAARERGGRKAGPRPLPPASAATARHPTLEKTANVRAAIQHTSQKKKGAKRAAQVSRQGACPDD
jgi:hypothetical protein